MIIERHIFGSQSGYKTLAQTSALGAAECKQLEGFAFGTPYAPQLRNSFADHWGYWSRPIGGNRRAITQVSLGPPDDAERVTLLFVSAVVSTDDWNTSLHGDAHLLLQYQDLWRWTPNDELRPLTIKLASASAWTFDSLATRRILRLVSLLEFSWAKRHPVFASETLVNLRELLAVERLLPPSIRHHYSAVYRGINNMMPVSINCLAKSVVAAPGCSIGDLSGPLSPYARLLAARGLESGRIPYDVISNYRQFSHAVIETMEDSAEYQDVATHTTPEYVTPKLGTAVRIAGPFMLLVAFAFLALGTTLGWTLRRTPPNPWPELTKAALTYPLTPGDEQVAALQALRDKFDSRLPSMRSEESSQHGVVGSTTDVETTIASRLKLSGALRDAQRLLDSVAPGDQEKAGAIKSQIDQISPLDPAGATSLLRRYEQCSRFLSAIRELKERHTREDQLRVTTLDNAIKMLDDELSILRENAGQPPAPLPDAKRRRLLDITLTLKTLKEKLPGLKSPNLEQYGNDARLQPPEQSRRENTGLQEALVNSIGDLQSFLKSQPNYNAVARASLIAAIEKLIKASRDLDHPPYRQLAITLESLKQWIPVQPATTSAPASQRAADQERDRMQATFDKCVQLADELRRLRDARLTSSDQKKQARNRFVLEVESLKDLLEERTKPEK